MAHFRATARSLALCSLCAFCSSPTTNCDVACPIPLAFTVAVTSSTSGAPIDSASLTLSAVPGDTYDPAPTACNQLPGNACAILGFAGTYSVQIAAPGYQTALRSITVKEGSSSGCCGSNSPGHLDVALVPTS